MAWFKSYPKSNLILGFVLLNLLVSAIFIAMFVVIVAIRSFYPYELEWIEGAGMDEIRWIMQGKPLYGPPSVSFIPSTKTPLYYILSAGITKILGYGFFAPRLLSIVASLGIFILLYLIVKGDRAHPVAGFLASGVMAASFKFTGAWLDLVKTDALFMFFLLAAFYVGQKNANKWGMVASGLLYVLAYYTKQLALVIIIALCISSLVETRGRAWIQWLTAGVIGFLVYYFADRTTNGWFSFYSVDTLTYHNWGGDLMFFGKTILNAFWPALLVGLLYPALSFNGLIRLKLPGQMWQNLSLTAATLAASGSVFLKSWTYDNGYIPAAVGIALLIGLGYDRILKSGDLSTSRWGLDRKSTRLNSSH
jgi:4-amino-4-deoxy-L-arabinose transferase-like glycosyltransferase